MCKFTVPQFLSVCSRSVFSRFYKRNQAALKEKSISSVVEAALGKGVTLNLLVKFKYFCLF